MLPLPIDARHTAFQPCCGKTLCLGCLYTQRKRDHSLQCAFCRTPGAIDEDEAIDRLKRGRERKHAKSTYQLALTYKYGAMGFKKDFAKALELYLEAGEYGSADAYYDVGYLYDNGLGVKRDVKKAKYYWELGAIGGSIAARHNLGCVEEEAGNDERALKHFLISAKAGFKPSLEKIKMGLQLGDITEAEYAEAARLYQKQQDDTSSAVRDEGAKYFEVA